MSTFHFTKMHGLGNDIVIVDAISREITLSKSFLQNFSHRHTGVGFDQLILIQSSQKADFACRIFNSDGSEAEQCGNGMRCVARFLHENKLHDNASLSLETPAGIVKISMHSYEDIAVEMGIPQIKRLLLPFPVDSLEPPIAVSMGNPHLILHVTSVANYPVSEIGEPLATHVFFPEGINVGFMEIINRDHIRLRTFERGVGKTFACGSNACAAVTAGIHQGLLNTQVRVELELGSLFIEWPSQDKTLVMRGPAEKVFEGVAIR